MIPVRIIFPSVPGINAFQHYTQILSGICSNQQLVKTVL
jgi:hypothetical protein